MSQGPLSGIKVIEFGQNLAGPYCGQILTFLGAEVLKVERPEGDDARRWGPPFIDEGDSPAVAFVALNRGKKSTVIDLNEKADCEILIKTSEPVGFGMGTSSSSRGCPQLVI